MCSKPCRRQDTGRRNLSAALRAVCVQTGGYSPTLCGYRRGPRFGVPAGSRSRLRCGAGGGRVPLCFFGKFPFYVRRCGGILSAAPAFMRLPLCAEEGKLRRLAMYPSVRPAPDRCSYPACGAGLRRPHIVSLQSLCSVLWIWREYSPSAAFDNLHAMRASKKADNRRFHQIAAEIYVQNADCNLTK